MQSDHSSIRIGIKNGYKILTMTLPLKNFSKVGQMHFHAMFGFIHTKVHKFKLSSSIEFLNDWKV
jgi:hypothetical protein